MKIFIILAFRLCLSAYTDGDNKIFPPLKALKALKALKSLAANPQAATLGRIHPQDKAKTKPR